MIRQILFAGLLLSSSLCEAQISPDSIQQRVFRYNQNLPQEKIYLHLDRSHYAPGDTIWFKAYVIDAATHTSDSISKNVYVDFYRKDSGRKLKQMVIKNSGGFALGNIALRDTLTEGVYEIRAFTNWMRNFPERQFFHREIYVRMNQGQTAIDSTSILEIADLQFFPEGGTLVAGLEGRVAFKGVNKYGRGVDFSAYIISDRGDTVATIRSTHLGMGSFIFAPKTGRRYFAKIAAGQTPLVNRFDLPSSSARGYAFFVDNLSSKEVIKVTARNNFSSTDRPVLVGQCRGVMLFNLQSDKGNSFSWSLKKSDIPSDGVVQLTLFDNNGKPQCERLIYNDTKTPLQVTVTLDKPEYAQREKVTLSLQVKDSKGNPVRGNFSLAVTDNQQVNFDNNSEDIRTYLQLSSDIQSLSDAGVRGVIEQPNYYFDSGNIHAPVQLDMLLMTQGWRRFTWTDVLSKKQPKETYEIETGPILRGKAKMYNGKKSAKPINISLMYSPEPGAKAFETAKTDADGNFIFRNILIDQPTTVMVQGAKDNGSRWITISVDEYEWPACVISKDAVDPFFSDVEQLKDLLARQKHYADLRFKFKNMKVTELKEVVVTAKKDKPIDPRRMMYQETNFFSIPVSRQSCATAQHVLQLLQGRVAKVNISFNGTDWSVIAGSNTSLTGIPNIAYTVDGMLMNIAYLQSIPPCSVESIDVVTHPVVLYNAQVLISILTKQGFSLDESESADPRGTVYAKMGYDVSREFYSPKYKLAEENSRSIPDFRATLYWNPIVKTDAEGKAQVTFWNSDEKTSVRVAVEGISSAGIPTAGKYEYSVK